MRRTTIKHTKAPCITAGRVACIRLGRTRVSKVFGSKQYLGTATRFRRPWFNVNYNDGNKEELSGHELARIVMLSPADFLDQSV